MNKKIIFLLRIMVVFMLLLTINNSTYAEYVFTESSINEIIPNCVVFKIVFAIIISIYIVEKILFIKKYKNFKKTLGIDLIIIGTLILTNIIVKHLIFSATTLGTINCINIVHIVIAIMVEIVGLIFENKILKNDSNISNELIMIIIMVIIVLIIIAIIGFKIIFEEMGDRMYGIDIYKSEMEKQYVIPIEEGTDIKYQEAKVKSIDKDGVLIEYNMSHYSKQANDNGVSLKLDKVEVVQQKLKWNVWYCFNPDNIMFPGIPSNYRCYIMFKR